MKCQIEHFLITVDAEKTFLFLNKIIFEIRLQFWLNKYNK
jgi:hypothetical protein